MQTFNIYTFRGRISQDSVDAYALVAPNNQAKCRFPPTPSPTIWMIPGFRKLDTMLAIFNLAIYT